jgi:hypothetical protein
MGFELDGCYLSQRYGFFLPYVYQDVMDRGSVKKVVAHQIKRFPPKPVLIKITSLNLP